ncbi:MAG: cytochrome D1 [Pyrinomonadaceae bacterium]|nr:cytochrome D1 [Pyrinomonadaceae bacterium]
MAQRDETASRLSIVCLKLIAILVSLLAVNSAQVHAQQESSRQSVAPQRYTLEGVAVEFTVEPVARGKTSDLLEGTEATVRFKITDTNANKAITNLRPAAWIARRTESKATDARGCREKVQSFLQASFSNRPDIDLNSYFILALNHEPNISVIDPISGLGTTKLYTLVLLPAPGEDWVMSRDKKRLYVSMPLVNQVAVVDTVSWKVLTNIAAGTKPARLALQHDEKYLWVGNDSAEESQSGVTVIDTTTLKVAAQLNTGAGHHEIAFTGDDRYAFITNKQAGTLSVIDVRQLVRVKDLKTGSLPTAVAFSSLGKAVYVAHEGDGTITAVDGLRHEILTAMKAQPGLHAMRFVPDGRYGFVVNRAANAVYIFDVSTNRLIHAVTVGPTPDQITFTKDFAYVRSSGNEFITMIKITELGKAGYEVAVNRFPAGQKAPQESSYTSLADAVVPAPEAGAVLVANPADKMIYFYSEGMAAPMGSFQNYRRDPKAVLALDNSLSETSPGLYTTTVRLRGQGQYDVAFLLDTPRMVNCFDLTVKENPELAKPQEVSIKVEQLLKDSKLRVGESYKLRFKVTDPSNGQPKAVKDMGVLVFLAPGIWQQREWANPVGDGVYEMSFVPPEAGVYYVFFQSPSLGVRYNQIPSLILHATKDAAASKPTGSQP